MKRRRFCQGAVLVLGTVLAFAGPARGAGVRTDRGVYPIPDGVQAPKAGEKYVDPTFGTEVLRVSDERDGKDVHNAYSYWPAFNSDSTRFHVNAGGRAMLYRFDPQGFRLLGKEPLFAGQTPKNTVPGWEDSVWSGVDGDVIFGHEGPRLWRYDVAAKQYALVRDFEKELPPGGHLGQMSKSLNDNVFAFSIKDEKYEGKGVFVWRRDTDRILVKREMPSLDEAQVDKSGRFCIIKTGKQGKGQIEVQVVDLMTGKVEDLTDDAPDFAPGHSDNGHGVVIGADNWRNRITFRHLARPHDVHTVLDLKNDWSQGLHVSLLSDDEDWALVSFYKGNQQKSSGVFLGEILLAATDGTQRVRRLVHHRSVYKSYWDSPRACMSRDGRFVLYTSNFNDAGRRDVFILKVPPAREAATPAAGGEASLPAKPIFEDGFDRGLENWVSEGRYEVKVADGRMHVRTSWDDTKNGQYVWFKKDLPADFRVEYDFTPVSKSGFFLIFFCAKGVKGEDILSEDLLEKYMPAKSWKPYQDVDKYVSGPNRKTGERINCYHISYRRNENANCNFRKNIGLNLLVSREVDAVLPAGKTTHVILTKKGGRVRLEVGGKVFMDHTDDGKINGPPYGAGKVGLRQVYDSEGYYDNFKVFDLTGKAPAEEAK